MGSWQPAEVNPPQYEEVSEQINKSKQEQLSTTPELRGRFFMRCFTNVFLKTQNTQLLKGKNKTPFLH